MALDQAPFAEAANLLPDFTVCRPSCRTATIVRATRFWVPRASFRSERRFAMLRVASRTLEMLHEATPDADAASLAKDGCVRPRTLPQNRPTLLACAPGEFAGEIAGRLSAPRSDGPSSAAASSLAVWKRFAG